MHPSAFPPAPHRPIRRSSRVHPLPAHQTSLDSLTFELNDQRLDVSGYMTRRTTKGLIVLQDGRVALERYANGSSATAAHTSLSAAKSLTSTLCAAALYDGAIGSLDDACVKYLPEFKGCAYANVTLRNILRMASGIRWNEAEESRQGALQRILGERQHGSTMTLLKCLEHASPQGTRFNYSTVESCLLGAVITAATGQTLADYCARTIWLAAGMEADGNWLLESDGGVEFGGFGVSLRLRDLARFGQLVLQDGEGGDGSRVLPIGWRDLAGQPDCAATSFGQLMSGSPLGYGYQWWALPHGPTGIHAGAFIAMGAFGQFLYIHPARRVVIAIQSDWPTHEDEAAINETFALLRAAVIALQ